MKTWIKVFMGIFCVFLLIAVGFSGIINNYNEIQEMNENNEQNNIENEDENLENEKNRKYGTRSGGGSRSTENNTGYEPWYYYVNGMVNPANGNLVYSMNDLSIRARGYNIDIIRSYNSLRASTDNEFGYGWTYNYDITLDNYGDYVIETDGDGSEHNFTSLSGDYYTSPEGVNSRLTKYSGDGLTLRFKNGADYEFDLDYDEYSTDTNTTGLYHLNTGSGGTASDSSGNGNNGAIGGASWTSNSRFGSYALDFDGDDDYIDFGDVFDLPTGAIEMWFNMSNNFNSSSSTDMMLFSKYVRSQGKEYSVRLKLEADDGKIYFVITNEDTGYSIYSNAASWIGNTWYHVAATWGLSGMKMYVNNSVQTDTDAYTGNWTDINSNAYVGASKDGNPYLNEFDGLIDEIRISDLQRTEFLDTYDNPGILTEIEDKNSNKLTFTYSSGKLVNITDDSGLYIKIDYNLNNRIKNVTDNSNRQVTYSYDVAGNLVNVTDPAGNKTYYQYTNHVMDRFISRVNKATNFTYYASGDAQGRVKEIWNTMYNSSADSYYDVFRQSLIIYDIDNGSVNVTNARNYNSTIKMNKYGNPTEISGPLTNDGSSIKKLGWEDNNLVTLTDGNNNSTYYKYDAYGNLIETKDPLEHVKTQSFSTTLSSSDYISVLTSNINNEIENNTYDFEENEASWESGGTVNDWEWGEPRGSSPSAHSGAKLWATKLDGNYRGDNDCWLKSPAYNVSYMETEEYPITVGYWINYSFGDVDDSGNCSIKIYYLDYTIDPTQIRQLTLTQSYGYGDANEGNWTYYSITTPNNVINITFEFNLDTDNDVHNGLGMYIDDVSIIGPSDKIKTSYGYDNNNNLNTTTNALGNSMYYNYDSYGNIVNSTDYRGNKTFYTYDTHGYQTQIQDALGNYTNFTYDAIGRQTSVNDSNGHNTTLEYDSLGRVSKITNPAGHATTKTYFKESSITKSETDANGQTTTYTMNWSVGKLEEITDALGNKTINYYDEVGNLIKITDARGYNTTFEYNSLNLKTKGTDAKGNYKTCTYDDNGNILTITDKRDNTSTFEYDELDRQIKITDPIGNFTTYSYDFNGNKINETNARGYTTNYYYEDLNRLIRVEDATGKNMNFTYDANGNKITTTDPNGNTITYSYDELNRMIKLSDPLNHNTSYEYDSVGNLINITDANSNSIIYEYDDLNRKNKVTNALGGEIVYEYDNNGNLLNITDENGNKTKQKYDTLNRLINVISPLGYSTLFKYDANGNLINRTDANSNITLNAYDELNRLTKTTYPDGSFLSISYDANGNLIQRINNGIGINDTINYTYDEQNRLISVKNDYGSFIKTINYTYNEIGSINTLEDPNGNTIYYTYDSLDRLTQIIEQDNEKFNFSYDNASRRTQLEYPNGAITTYTYDNANRLTNITNKNSANSFISSFEYTYDNVGNRLNVTENNGNLTEYTYDVLYRLTNVTYPSGSFENFIYDAAGNRISRETGGLTSLLYYDNDNRLTRDGIYTYYYDSNGNLLKKSSISLGTTYYEYDYENRIIKVTLPNSSWVTYNYSTEGKRIGISNNGNTYYYVYNLEDILLELESGVSQNAIFIHGPGIDEPLKMNRSNNKYYYQFDGLGSVDSLTDSNENIVATYQYYAFGDVLYESGSVNNPYKFTSREYDNFISLYYYRARHYDQSKGRFLQKDIIGINEGANLYVYVSNNPITNIDPMGREPIRISEWNDGLDISVNHKFPEFGESGYDSNQELPVVFGGMFELGNVRCISGITQDTITINPKSGILILRTTNPQIIFWLKVDIVVHQAIGFPGWTVGFKVQNIDSSASTGENIIASEEKTYSSSTSADEAIFGTGNIPIYPSGLTPLDGEVELAFTIYASSTRGASKSDVGYIDVYDMRACNYEINFSNQNLILIP